MMSEVRAAEAAGAAANERSRAMGQLLSAISHELCTPMSSIVGFSELLRTVALADRRRLRQALINLIGNAIKFNRPGGSVATELAVAGDRVQLRIDDTGSGLPRSRDGLFEPFHRLGAERSVVPRTGLGLTISKQVIEAMGGQLEIDDRADGERGTTVLVSRGTTAGTAGEGG